ncbi:hypothetical protein KUCAC02_027490 [Chaenocephalus aceratus]|uniref:Uncharacterized protein n=1 Tax=Chaenocephalus aceratus TaxID=36190 RepID=A0ACB9W3Y0_CHAAC|nr:hypothetical protein KUCAC02_027490 [Chaenocephalus aceratus]
MAVFMLHTIPHTSVTLKIPSECPRSNTPPLGSKWQRGVTLIIHGLLLPALLKVAVLKAAGQKGSGDEGEREEGWRGQMD